MRGSGWVRIGAGVAGWVSWELSGGCATEPGGDSEQHDESVDSGEAAVDGEDLPGGLAEGFERDGDVSSGGGAAERERGILAEAEFIANAGDDASGEVVICEANYFEGIGAGKVVACFDQFSGWQLEHGCVQSGVLVGFEGCDFFKDEGDMVVDVFDGAFEDGFECQWSGF